MKAAEPICNQRNVPVTVRGRMCRSTSHDSSAISTIGTRKPSSGLVNSPVTVFCTPLGMMMPQPPAATPAPTSEKISA